jgi:hypothetical protein
MFSLLYMLHHCCQSHILMKEQQSVASIGSGPLPRPNKATTFVLPTSSKRSAEEQSAACNISFQGNIFQGNSRSRQGYHTFEGARVHSQGLCDRQLHCSRRRQCRSFVTPKSTLPPSSHISTFPPSPSFLPHCCK